MLRNVPYKLLLPIFTLVLAYSFIWAQEKTTAEMRPHASPRQSDKPVEEFFKNIKVFRGMPRSQFPRTMDFMTASLGVDCDYCHVSPAWESDVKLAKEVSRQMVAMMRDINDKNFSGKPIVNCATCHQGHPKPVAEPPLDQIALRTRLSHEPAKPAATVSLPSAEWVINRYVEAVGGRSAFEKLNSRLIKSTLSLADGTTASQEVYMKAPDKAVFITTTHSETTSQGFTGAIGWLKNSHVRRELSGPTLNQLRFNSEFNREIRLKELFAEMRVTGKEKVGDREVYMIEAKSSYSDPRNLYFDTETGLLIRTLIEESSPLGSILDQIDFSDYRSVDGVKLPFLIRRTSQWENSVMRIIEVKHNVSISDVRFDMRTQ